MSAEYTLFGALGTVQIMSTTGCSREVAVTALAQVSGMYDGADMTGEMLTSMLLDAINWVRAGQEVGT